MKTIAYSEEDFGEFSRHIMYWVEAFGLSEWTVTVLHDQIEDPAPQAQTRYNCERRQAAFVLAKQISYDFGAIEDMRLLALHEVLHLVVSDYGWMASKAHDLYSDITNAAEHALINRLLGVISACQSESETTE